MAKMRYEKERVGKLVSKGGPRDIQNRQQLMRQDRLVREIIESEIDARPKMATTNKLDKPVESVDLSQYIHLDEVRKKLEEAAEFTRKEEKIRYENESKNLTNKLDESIKELEVYKKKLLIKDHEISVLTGRLNELTDSDYSSNMRILQEKLDKLYTKISDGSIGPLVGSNMGRPALEDRIFIDPLRPEDTGDLDSHIDVKEEVVSASENRNITSDIAKLRELLKR